MLFIYTSHHLLGHISPPLYWMRLGKLLQIKIWIGLRYFVFVLKVLSASKQAY